MRNIKAALASGIALLVTASFAGPAAAQNRQQDKNNMRNLAMGLGAAAVYKSIKGDPKTGLLLGAGALYAAKKYEDQRKAQAKDAELRRRYSRSRSSRSSKSKYYRSSSRRSSSKKCR